MIRQDAALADQSFLAPKRPLPEKMPAQTPNGFRREACMMEPLCLNDLGELLFIVFSPRVPASDAIAMRVDICKELT